MSAFTEEQIRAHEQYMREQEEAELWFVRILVDSVDMWQHCEKRTCRRERGCRVPRFCQRKYEADILWWKRTVLVPYLRERYPTVQWGGPPDIVARQHEAALAAEKEEEARRQGRPVPPSAESNVARQPLYVPGDV
jgi:hypothetical protein